MLRRQSSPTRGSVSQRLLLTRWILAANIGLGFDDLKPRNFVLLVQIKKARSISWNAVSIAGGTFSGVGHVEPSLLHCQSDEHPSTFFIHRKASHFRVPCSLGIREFNHADLGMGDAGRSGSFRYSR